MREHSMHYIHVVWIWNHTNTSYMPFFLGIEVLVFITCMKCWQILTCLRFSKKSWKRFTWAIDNYVASTINIDKTSSIKISACFNRNVERTKIWICKKNLLLNLFDHLLFGYWKLNCIVLYCILVYTYMYVIPFFYFWIRL